MNKRFFLPEQKKDRPELQGSLFRLAQLDVRAADASLRLALR